MDLLKFSTAGSVDDGKSTLIGRLLFDTNSIAKDQIEAVIAANKKKGNDFIDLALLTDGLMAEREQGITIDVSYKYFSSQKRKYIISDCPGHIEYTRNMVTGVSDTELIILLIDARKGVLEQTKRHYYIAKMMGVTEFIVCINKMDLVDNSQEIYNSIKNDFLKLTKSKSNQITFIPTSALNGDNIVTKSSSIKWYKGQSVYQCLENITLDKTGKSKFRFPVQYVIRNQEGNSGDYRGFSGRVESGEIAVGDKVTVYPSGIVSKIINIDVFDKKVSALKFNEYGTIILEKDIDVSRGDILIESDEKIELKNECNGILCWMGAKPFTQKAYLMKHGTNEIKCKIIECNEILNIDNLSFEQTTLQIGMQQNDIVKTKIKLSKSIVLDKFSEIKQTGCFVLVDEQTNQTVASGTII